MNRFKSLNNILKPFRLLLLSYSSAFKALKYPKYKNL